MSKKLLIALFISVIVHIVIVFIAPSKSQINSNEQDSSTENTQSTIPASKISVTITEDSIIETEPIKNGMLSIKSNSCTSNKHYIGVGILFSTNVFGLVNITEVAAGSPAEKAGLTIDDIIVDETALINDYKIGDKLILKIKRGESILDVEMITEKICYEN